MTGRKQSGGRELAIRDPARPGAEGDNTRGLRRLLEMLLTKYALHVAEEKPLEHGVQLHTCEGPIINIFSTGTVQLQGRRTHLAREFVEELRDGIGELRHHRWLSLIARQAEDDAL
jgi:hypothetical protein